MENQELQNKKHEVFKDWIFVFLFCAFIFIDQLTKFFIKDAFLNKNFAFSIPLPIAAIYLIYFFVIAGIISYLVKNYRQMSFGHKFGWTLILAGASSNIVERIFFGAVKDFIYIHWRSLVGIYNIADFYIILGILILLVSSGVKDDL